MKLVKLEKVILTTISPSSDWKVLQRKKDCLQVNGGLSCSSNDLISEIMFEKISEDPWNVFVSDHIYFYHGFNNLNQFVTSFQCANDALLHFTILLMIVFPFDNHPHRGISNYNILVRKVIVKVFSTLKSFIPRVIMYN